MSVTIQNGSIKYGETRKLAEYESKTGHVELSFSIDEGADPDEAIQHVTEMVHRHAHHVLNLKQSAASPDVSATKAPAGKAARTPTKIPATPVADKPAAKSSGAAAAMVEEPGAAATTEMPPIPASLKREPATVIPEDDGLGDLMGGAEPAKLITDKELTDHTQQCQAKNKNAPAIRKALNDCGVKHPPGRIIDLPQERRQEYLDKLKEIKPLA